MNCCLKAPLLWLVILDTWIETVVSNLVVQEYAEIPDKKSVVIIFLDLHFTMTRQLRRYKTRIVHHRERGNYRPPVHLAIRNKWWRYYIETELGNVPSCIIAEISSELKRVFLRDQLQPHRISKALSSSFSSRIISRLWTWQSRSDISGQLWLRRDRNVFCRAIKCQMTSCSTNLNLYQCLWKVQ